MYLNIKNMNLKLSTTFLLAFIAQAGSSNTSEAKLTASDGAASDYFGKSASIDGNAAIVGAYHDDFNLGSAYIYEKDSTSGTWVEAVKLTASDGAAGDYFGWSVAISGNTAIVGAYQEDDDNLINSGAAYIYEKDATSGTWVEAVKLTASDGAASDMFGWSVAISGNTYIVGAHRDDDKAGDSGAAYIFEKNSTSGTWVEIVKLTASDGAASDMFGYSVAISGNTAIVAAINDDDKGNDSGAAYIYEKDSTSGTWVEAVKLTASDGAASDWFGKSVAVSNDVVVVGADGDDDNGDLSGSAYIYEKDATSGTWVEAVKLMASDGAAGDYFGSGVSVDGNTAIVGAYQEDDDNLINSGAAYIYEKDSESGAWVEAVKLTAPDRATSDWFGCSVAISGNTAIVGADLDDDNGRDSGAAYIYEKNSTSGTWTLPTASLSENPSSVPSESPSYEPSSTPSERLSSHPSLTPSESPSLQPSSILSESPSAMSSESPSSQPSSMPSSMPSCTPSQAPTTGSSINLFYPDFTADGYAQGCLNDGNQPAYINSNQGTYMHSTLDICCSTHFAWNYNGCMGNVDDACSRALWYPDWEGYNTGCIRDGNEPLYMTQNAAVFLFNTKTDCCNEYYKWGLDDCFGTSSRGSGSKYYADWLGDDTCKNDGGAPSYMVQNPTQWLYDTLSTCCSAHYSWKIDECLGSTTTKTTSGLYYPDWSGDNEGCLNDGDEPEYMTQYSSMWLHSTLQACCEANYAWVLSTCLGTSGGTGSTIWYMSWSANKCVQDCVGASPCGGLAESWDATYSSQDECCTERMWWDTTSCKS